MSKTMKLLQDQVDTKIEAQATINILCNILPDGWKLSWHDLGCVWIWNTRNRAGCVIDAGFIVIGSTLMPPPCQD
jgi:hypothetical protein